ncbi:hypothetical protein FDUTEX481_03167 [Tolypothrix sp. PCC 7601]|nr:hypothetical protein FDUTEX481_03167 [Tolypothrix sp. PCC 7601]
MEVDKLASTVRPQFVHSLQTPVLSLKINQFLVFASGTVPAK